MVLKKISIFALSTILLFLGCMALGVVLALLAEGDKKLLLHILTILLLPLSSLLGFFRLNKKVVNFFDKFVVLVLACGFGSVWYIYPRTSDMNLIFAELFFFSCSAFVYSIYVAHKTNIYEKAHPPKKHDEHVNPKKSGRDVLGK